MDAAWDTIIDRLRSPHADKIYVAKEYTKADLIRDLEQLCEREAAEWLRSQGYTD